MNSELQLAFETLLEAATWAPSGDNVQPWRFEMNLQKSQLVVHVDESRDTSPMNAGQTMSRIAVGAAVENIMRTVEWNGGSAIAHPARDGSLVSIEISFRERDTPIQYEPIIPLRVTNRKRYSGEPIPPEILSKLREAACDQNGNRTHWISNPQKNRHLARLVSRADKIMFGNKFMRAAFLANVRFDVPKGSAVEEGLSIESLEMTKADERAFRILPKLPNWCLRLIGVGGVFAKKSEKLADSVSGFCLITAPDNSPSTDIAVGRSMQRAWLTLTEEGLAAQPMMSLVVLNNAMNHGSPSLCRSLDEHAIKDLTEELLHQVEQNAQACRPAFLLRFGYSDAPSGRCGRMSTQ